MIDEQKCSEEISMKVGVVSSPTNIQAIPLLIPAVKYLFEIFVFILCKETLKTADLEDYLASDDDDDDDDDSDDNELNGDQSIEGLEKIQRLRARLLGNSNKSESIGIKSNVSNLKKCDDVDIEISFDAPLVSKDQDLKTLGTKSNNKTKKSKKHKREVVDPNLALVGVGDDELYSLSRGRDKHMKDSVRSDKNQMKADASGSFKVDNRFDSLFTSPDFALDPTDPRYKKDEHAAIMDARRKRQHVSNGKASSADIKEREITLSAKNLAKKLKSKKLLKNGNHL